MNRSSKPSSPGSQKRPNHVDTNAHSFETCWVVRDLPGWGQYLSAAGHGSIESEYALSKGELGFAEATAKLTEVTNTDDTVQFIVKQSIVSSV